jgi:O-acetyl-ADP-ribose deacetylase
MKITVDAKMGEENEDSMLSKAESKFSETFCRSWIQKHLDGSSGIFWFPKDSCTKIQIQESKRFLEDDMTSIQTIEFCLFDDETLGYFISEFRRCRSTRLV